MLTTDHPWVSGDGPGWRFAAPDGHGRVWLMEPHGAEWRLFPELDPGNPIVRDCLDGALGWLWRAHWSAIRLWEERAAAG